MHFVWNRERGIEVWSIDKREIIRQWALPDVRAVEYLKFSGDYQYLAIYWMRRDFRITIWDYFGEKEIQSFNDVMGGGNIGEPYPMTFVDGSESFAFANRDEVCLYGSKTWEEIWCFPSAGEADQKGKK